MTNIRFFLQKNYAERWQAYPMYKDGLSIDYEPESSQMFFRKKLSDKIIFDGDDFKKIMACPFDTEFHLYVEKQTNGTWNEIAAVKFHLTDCTINIDDKKISAQTDPLDQYTEVLDGWEKEFNLVKLAPEIKRCNILKRPLLQYYVQGDNIVTNYLGGMKWEQDAESTDNEAVLLNTYHFNLDTICKEMRVYGTGFPVAEGVYYAKLPKDSTKRNFDVKMYRYNNDDYYIHFRQTTGVLLIALCNSANDTVLYKLQAVVNWLNDGTVNLSPVGSQTGMMTADFTTRFVYCRMLLDVTSYNGVATSKIPATDIVESNINYRYCVGYTTNAVTIYGGWSNTPTEYGLINDDRYFTAPNAQPYEAFYPIAQSRWRNASLWVERHNIPLNIDEYGARNYILRDAYPISTCIARILGEITTEVIRFEPTPEYSQFLYGDVNPMAGYPFDVLITPKSNIVAGEYTQAAQKGLITLKGLLDMLKNVFQCYWYIEDGKFKIEHIQYFKNGGSYEDVQEVGYDLTLLKNVKNGKYWGYDKNEYSFDRMDMPERYVFKWMDDCTLGFEGMPIEVLSKIVQVGKKEEINVPNFTADVDYMLTMPNEVSKDGFALLCTSASSLFIQNPQNVVVENGGYSDYIETRAMDSDYTFATKFYATSIGVNESECNIVFYDSEKQEITSYYPSLIQTSEEWQTMNLVVPRGTSYIRLYCDSGEGVRLSIQECLTNEIGQLPLVTASVENANIKIQNGYCAFVVAQPKYWLYDMPTYRVKVNGEETLAYSVMQKKKQNVNIPTDLIIPDEEFTRKLVKTFLGYGKIEKLSLNLSSGLAKTTLKYDTEQQP